MKRGGSVSSADHVVNTLGATYSCFISGEHRLSEHDEEMSA